MAQPPVRTLAVPDELRTRLEAAHELIEAEHPRGLTLQQVLNALIVCGLEAIEIDTAGNVAACSSSALQSITNPDATRRTQKHALRFLSWYVDVPASQGVVSPQTARAIDHFAPHLSDEITVDTFPPDDPELAALREAFRRQVKPQVVERVYDDSVQEPLTASEQGRD